MFFVLENNGYGQGISQMETGKSTRIKAQAWQVHVYLCTTLLNLEIGA